MRAGFRALRIVLSLASLSAATVAVPAAPAAAQVGADVSGRRPGLGGRYTRRSLTVARNALYAIAGPWAPMLLGQRRDGYGYDGGVQLVQSEPDAIAGIAAANAAPDDLLVDLNMGVGFGLFDHFEAGAMFLSFRFTPDFAYGGFPVFLTYWWEVGPVDIGARVVWFTFYDDAIDPNGRQTTLNPSAPMVVHLGTSRIDTGIFFPIGFRRLPFDFRWADDDRVDVAPGLSIPLRYSYNPIPELVLGVETGFYDDDLGTARDLSMPLGFHLGGTFLLGNRILDVGAVFQWDHFLRPGAPADTDTLQTGYWRVSIGASLARVVL